MLVGLLDINSNAAVAQLLIEFNSMCVCEYNFVSGWFQCVPVGLVWSILVHLGPQWLRLAVIGVGWV